MSSADTPPLVTHNIIIGVDDSCIELEGKHHTILGGVILHLPNDVENDILAIKAKYGVETEELKWSGFPTLTREQKRSLGQEILPIISNFTGFIVVVEGHDKRAASQEICNQINDLFGTRERILIHFDQQINKKSSLSKMMTGKDTDIEVVDSKNSIAVQCADIFIGYQKLRIENKLGLSPIPSINTEDGEMDFGFYMFAQTRYSLWGEVQGNFSNEDEMFEAMNKLEYPIKISQGKGLRIFSSVSHELQDRIYKECGNFWMGCIH